MGLKLNDVVQVTWMGLCFGQQVLMVRNWLVTSDFPAAQSVATDLDHIITQVDAAGINDVTTPYLACLPPQYALKEIRAQRIRVGRSAYRSVFPVGFVGTNANAATTVNDAAALTFQGPDASRSNIGTVHVGPAPDGASAAGNITAAYTLLLQNLSVPLKATFAVDGVFMLPILYNRKLQTWNQIVSSRVGLTSRVQRRRTVGVGK